VKVLFVGSNPGSASPDNSAFHPSSKTRLTLESWISNVDCESYYINVADYKTPNNRALTSKEIKLLLPSLKVKISAHEGFKIVAVGLAAAKALKLIDADFLAIPHPSGRTRQYNDKAFKAATINTLILFIKGYNINTGV
jgi:uracil-DNA glycosylase family 4